MLPPLSRLMPVDSVYGEHSSASEPSRITTTLLARVVAVIALIGKHYTCILPQYLPSPPPAQQSDVGPWARGSRHDHAHRRAWPASTARVQLPSHRPVHSGLGHHRAIV